MMLVGTAALIVEEANIRRVLGSNIVLVAAQDFIAAKVAKLAKP